MHNRIMALTAGKYFLKVNNKDTQIMSMGFFLIFLLVTLNKYLSVRLHVILVSFLDLILWV